MIYAAIAVLVCAADQYVKHLISSNLEWFEQIDVVPGLFSLTRCTNTGGAFSMLSDYTWALSIVSVVCIALMIVLLCLNWLSRGEKLALSAVMGGAAGNAIDRIFSGEVVDMFVFVPTGLSVFNVADIFICVGGALFCLLYLIRVTKEEKNHRPSVKGGEMPELKRLLKADVSSDRPVDRLADFFGNNVDSAAVSGAAESAGSGQSNILPEDSAPSETENKGDTFSIDDDPLPHFGRIEGGEDVDDKR